jgi:transcriptional regulator with PAS, ATPase and Fis domain
MRVARPVITPMLGQSAVMAALHSSIEKVAPTNSTVLIRGESGTGKELVARAIHAFSRRVQGPFVAVNCAALTESIVESELFGHVRGAFTGADALKMGKFELASGGTLFLDEIGELTLSTQGKLLRALQEHEIDRVGGKEPIPVDIRLVAATHRNLESGIQAGTFREDLYYRLTVISLRTPPLRERREDIIPLAHYFVLKFAELNERVVAGISDEAQSILENYYWPGNVRQLEHFMEQAVVLGEGNMVERSDLPQDIFRTPARFGSERKTYHQIMLDTERQVIGGALAEAKGDYTVAGKLTGLHPKSIHRLATRLNLNHMVGRRMKETGANLI